MPRDPEESIDFLSRVFRAIQFVTITLVAVIGAAVAVAALDFQVSDRWSNTSVPLWLTFVLIFACFALLGVLAVILLILLRDSIRAISFYSRKVTTLERSLLEFRSLAFTDPITGVPNSNALRYEIEQMPTASRRCLIMLDLRDFRSINKKFNHWRGDEYLHEFARMVFGKTRRDEQLYKSRNLSEVTSDLNQDARAFRKAGGSDEFFMLLEGTVVDGLGFLNRLIARRSEFEEMSKRILGEVHAFGFTAGLIELAPDEGYDSCVQRVSVCLQKAGDPQGPSDVYWPPALIKNPLTPSASRIVELAMSNFRRVANR